MSEYQVGKSVKDIQKQAGDIKIYKLSSNENPIGPSPKAVEAIKKTCNELHFYPQRHDTNVTQVLAEHFGQALTPEHFIGANGAVDLINLLENAMFKQNASNSIVICPPCFGSYAASAKLKGATVIEHPLHSESFDIDALGLKDSVSDDTRLVYVCNPNNPTGSYFGQQALTQILDSLPDHVTLVYDEVYYHFATEFNMPDAIQCVLENKNIIILHSFSKAYGLAGLRAGYAIAPPHIIEHLKQYKLSFQNDAISMAAMVAAINDKDFINATVENNTQQRAWLRTQLTQLKIKFWPSQANFICFEAPNNQSAKALTDQLLQYGVMVRPAFYLPNHVRVSVGLPEANQAFIQAMSDILEKLN